MSTAGTKGLEQQSAGVYSHPGSATHMAGSPTTGYPTSIDATSTAAGWSNPAYQSSSTSAGQYMAGQYSSYNSGVAPSTMGPIHEKTSTQSTTVNGVPTYHHTEQVVNGRLVNSSTYGTMPANSSYAAVQGALLPGYSGNQYGGAATQYTGAATQYTGAATQYTGAATQYTGAATQYPGPATQYTGPATQYGGSQYASQYQSGTQYAPDYTGGGGATIGVPAYAGSVYNPSQISASSGAGYGSSVISPGVSFSTGVGTTTNGMGATSSTTGMGATSSTTGMGATSSTAGMGATAATGEYTSATSYSGMPATRITTGGTSATTGATVTGTRIIGHEYGEQRVIAVNQRVDETRTQIVGERWVEHEIRVPKRIVREEIIEKVIIIPEKYINEEIIEDTAIVKEKIVEIARPVIIEKVIEVPEIEYVEKVIEVPEKMTQERIKKVDKVELVERIQEVVKVIPQERIVEIPDIQYREVPVERIVEIPEVVEEVVVNEIPVPQYIDKPMPNVIQKDKHIDIERNIPIPVEANILYEFQIPRIKPRYHKLTYPVYIPRFIEVPVPMELLQGGLLQEAEQVLAQVGTFTRAAAALCDIETLASEIFRSNLAQRISTVDLQSTIMKSWKEGSLNIGPGGNVIVSGDIYGGVSNPASYGQYYTAAVGGTAAGGTMAGYSTTGGSNVGGTMYGSGPPSYSTTTGSKVLPNVSMTHQISNTPPSYGERIIAA